MDHGDIELIVDATALDLEVRGCFSGYERSTDGRVWCCRKLQRYLVVGVRKRHVVKLNCIRVGVCCDRLCERPTVHRALEASAGRSREGRTLGSSDVRSPASCISDSSWFHLERVERATRELDGRSGAKYPYGLFDRVGWVDKRVGREIAASADPL